MKYPVTVVSAAVGWNIIDADGAFVSAAYTEDNANFIRDAMNKCAPLIAPKTLPISRFDAMDAWGWYSRTGAPLMACLSEGFANRSAAADGVRPVRGRFIPDNLTPEQVYAEIARLLNLLEPTVDAPCVQRAAMSKFLDGTLDVELDENGHAIRWTREDVEGIFTQIGDDIDGACEEIHEHVNWEQLASDHRAGEDADARCSDAD